MLSLCLMLWAEQRPKAALVFDDTERKILHAHAIKEKRRPASLTKLMSLYILFADLQSGRISMNTRFKVSKLASMQEPSKLNLKPGETISVKDAIQAIVVKSANDVVFAVAEGIGKGSVQQFVKRMNHVAKALNMEDTVFHNPTGLPNPPQLSTALDMLKLARAIHNRFPQYFHYFRQQRFVYHGKTYKSHNKILDPELGINGMKTGYTNAAGFNIVTTAMHYKKGQKPKRLFVVLMGEDKAKIRDDKAVSYIRRFLFKK